MGHAEKFDRSIFNKIGKILDFYPLWLFLELKILKFCMTLKYFHCKIQLNHFSAVSKKYMEPQGSIRTFLGPVSEQISLINAINHKIFCLRTIFNYEIKMTKYVCRGDYITTSIIALSNS